MEKDGNNERQPDNPGLTSLQEFAKNQQLKQNFLALWKTRVG
jgi:hypothetical protein